MLEVLVVVFVGTVLFALVGGAMVRTLRSSRQETNRMTRMMTARLVMEHLTRDLESAYPYRSPGTGQILFEGVDRATERGAADGITLLRPRLGAPVPNELEKVMYGVEEVSTTNGSHQVVVCRRTPLGSGAESRELTLGLPEPSADLKLNLEYLSPGPQGLQWTPGWEAGRGLPRAVKVKLEVTDRRMAGPVELESVVYVHSEAVREGTP